MSKARPGVVTEVIFIKYLWQEISLFLYKLVNFFKTLRRNITGDFLDGPVLLWASLLHLSIQTLSSSLLSSHDRPIRPAADIEYLALRQRIWLVYSPRGHFIWTNQICSLIKQRNWWEKNCNWENDVDKMMLTSENICPSHYPTCTCFLMKK